MIKIFHKKPTALFLASKKELIETLETLRVEWKYLLSKNDSEHRYDVFKVQGEDKYILDNSLLSVYCEPDKNPHIKKDIEGKFLYLANNGSDNHIYIDCSMLPQETISDWGLLYKDTTLNIDSTTHSTVFMFQDNSIIEKKIERIWKGFWHKRRQSWDLIQILEEA